jgi:hypothetical protein
MEPTKSIAGLAGAAALLLTAAAPGTAAAAGHEVTTQNLPAAVAGQPYTATLADAGGSGTEWWGVIGGALPAGLTLDVRTGQISGVPMAAGTGALIVGVTDSSDDMATARLNIQVDGAPALASPDAGMTPAQ